MGLGNTCWLEFYTLGLGCMFFGRKSHPSPVICFIFIFINTILVVSAQKKKKKKKKRFTI